MKLTPLIQKAINIASKLHNGQERKSDDNLPYIVHPFSVAWLLAEHTDDENIIAAGLLHDVIEDVAGYNFNNLADDFGANIAKLVKQVSEDKSITKPTNGKSVWQQRKEKYIAGLEQADSGALLIAAADKIHNLRSLQNAYRQQGASIWQRFAGTPDQQMWYYKSVLAVLKKYLNNSIVKDLDKEIANANQTLKLL
ncbi:MAG: HD domain-containing protein [Candidatus Komeilibacteria bacterium]